MLVAKPKKRGNHRKPNGPGPKRSRIQLRQSQANQSNQRKGAHPAKQISLFPRPPLLAFQPNQKRKQQRQKYLHRLRRHYKHQMINHARLSTRRSSSKSLKVNFSRNLTTGGYRRSRQNSMRRETRIKDSAARKSKPPTHSGDLQLPARK